MTHQYYLNLQNNILLHRYSPDIAALFDNLLIGITFRHDTISCLYHDVVVF